MERKNRLQIGIEALKCTAMIVAVAVLLWGMISLCNYLVIDDSQSYTRLTLHEFYESEEPIETIFLGTSHCFRAYDPMLYEKMTGESAFNLGSSSQNIDTSYYLLKEAFKYQNIKKVYLDIYYVFLFFNPDNRELVEANIISDYMRPSFNKASFILHRSSSKHYTNSFLPFRREWQLLGDFDYLKENLKRKTQESYQNYDPVVYDNERYVAKGFVESTVTLDTTKYEWIPKSEPIDLSGDSSFAVSYLEKIVNLCKAEGVELIFLTAPSYSEYLETQDSYEIIHEYIGDIASSYGVEYYDFNEDLKNIPEFTADDFMDEDHLNGNGAKKTTSYLAELVLHH